MRGHSRINLFLAKLFSYYALGLILSVFVTFLALAIYLPGWTQVLPTNHLLRCVLVRVLCDIGIMSLPFLLAFIFRDLIKTMAISVGLAIIVYLFIPSGDNENMIHKALALHPAFLLDKALPQSVVLISKPDALLISVATLFSIALIVSYIILRRTEFKW